MASYSIPFINTASISLTDNNFVVKILAVFTISLFLFTNLIHVNPGHFLAIFATALAGFIYIQSNVDTNYKIMEKMVFIETDAFKPKFIYQDADLIEIFHSLKLDFYQYNPKVYDSALKACDNLLRIKKDMNLELLPQPIPVNNNINFEDDPSLKVSSSKKPGKTVLVNAYENYEAAKIQYKLCVNHIFSYIVSIPSNPVIHEKYNRVTKKAQLLLKRNLDEIYQIYKKNKRVYDRDITNYDLQEPYNSYGKKGISTAFEYI